MPRTSKGARLVWRDESRKADGSLRNRAGWFIRDGSTFASACGGTGDLERAQKPSRNTSPQNTGHQPNATVIQIPSR